MLLKDTQGVTTYHWASQYHLHAYLEEWKNAVID